MDHVQARSGRDWAERCPRVLPVMPLGAHLTHYCLRELSMNPTVVLVLWIVCATEAVVQDPTLARPPAGKNAASQAATSGTGRFVVAPRMPARATFGAKQDVPCRHFGVRDQNLLASLWPLPRFEEVTRRPALPAAREAERLAASPRPVRDTYGVRGQDTLQVPTMRGASGPRFGIRASGPAASIPLLGQGLVLLR
jgi:hypothetical protein